MSRDSVSPSSLSVRTWRLNLGGSRARLAPRPLARPASPRIEDGGAARREPVADVEGLGEPELLELAHVALEARGVVAELSRELGRAHRRTAIDDRERGSGPRAD